MALAEDVQHELSESVHGGGGVHRLHKHHGQQVSRRCNLLVILVSLLIELKFNIPLDIPYVIGNALPSQSLD